MTAQSERSCALSNAPIGTRAPSINGGYWVRVLAGWKWCNGDIFPTVGGDWSGDLILPEVTNEQRAI